MSISDWAWGKLNRQIIHLLTESPGGLPAATSRQHVANDKTVHALVELETRDMPDFLWPHLGDKRETHDAIDARGLVLWSNQSAVSDTI